MSATRHFATRLVLSICAIAIPAAAIAEADSWYVAPAIVHTDDDGARFIDDGVAGAQVSVGRGLSDHLSIEGLLGYSDISGWEEPGLSIPDQSHLDISLNVLAFPNRELSFSPYVLAGVGYLGVGYSTGGNENRPSATAGLGFLWRMGESRVSIRGDYRARLAYEKDNNLTDYIATLGVQIGFGAARSAAVEQLDSDGDGVDDYWDWCPATPAGTTVDRNGCPEAAREPADTDRDGVPDSRDACPDTADGVAVDARGCPRETDRDSDGDGVPDRLDQCPGTTAGVRTDVNGCEIRDIIALPGVNFATNSDRLLDGAESLVAQAADTLKKYPELIIEVAGHTDSVGIDDTNYSLSERRAKTVRDYLVGFGVEPARLSVRGYGETRPVASNDSEAGRAENRRVELRILNITSP
jgi:OOP family OmpA-OmpF porin